MYIICSREVSPKERYIVVNVMNGKRFKLNREDILKSISQNNIYGNISIREGNIEGRGYPITRFSRFIEQGRIYVFERVIKNRTLKYYRAVSAQGNVFNIPSDREFFKNISKRYSIVNGYIKHDSRLDTYDLVLYKNSYHTRDITQIEINREYDTEDYIQLYKDYNNFGISKDRLRYSERVSSKIGEKTYGGVLIQALESDIESFITYHKCISRVLRQIQTATCSRVYNKYTLAYRNNNFICEPENLWGYIISSSIKDIDIKIPISARDLKLKKLIYKEILEETEQTPFDNFLDLVLYENDIEEQDSIDTLEEKLNLFNEEDLNKLKNYIRIHEVTLTLNKGVYINKNLGLKLIVRNDLKVNSGDKRIVISTT